MKTWLIVVSAVVVLLAASTGVGFWMFMDTKAELTDTRTALTNTETMLTEIQEDLEDNFGHEPEEAIFYPWSEPPEGKYPWCAGIEEAIHDLQLRIEDLEWPVGQAESISDIEQRVEELEWDVLDLQWAVRDLEDAVQDLEWQVLW